MLHVGGWSGVHRNRLALIRIWKKGLAPPPASSALELTWVWQLEYNCFLCPVESVFRDWFGLTQTVAESLVCEI